ncbi:hypothetical protein RDABS01_024133 [Bienertia sinuspersici]
MESPGDLRAPEHHFREEEVELIRQILLSHQQPVDRWYWWPTTDENILSSQSTGWGDLDILGNLGVPPKFHHFMWRACRGALATRGRLFDRHILDDGACQSCGIDIESIMHAMLHCPLVRLIWKALLSMFASMRPQLAPLLSVLIAWAAWSYRNSIVFGNHGLARRQGCRFL